MMQTNRNEEKSERAVEEYVGLAKRYMEYDFASIAENGFAIPG